MKFCTIKDSAHQIFILVSGKHISKLKINEVYLYQSQQRKKELQQNAEMRLSMLTVNQIINHRPSVKISY